MVRRGGRPRKANVERDAKGRIKASVYRLTKSDRRDARESLARDQQAMSVWRRVRDLVEAAAIDPRLGSAIGRMMLLGEPVQIDSAMFEAGVRFAQVLFLYDTRVIGRFTHAQAQDLSRIRGLSLGDDQPGRAKDAANAYATCLTALGAVKFPSRDPDGTVIEVQKPGDMARAVMAACRDEGGYYNPALVKEGLRALADHWGLYDNEERRMVRWRDRIVIAARAARVTTPDDVESFLAMSADDGVSHHADASA